MSSWALDIWSQEQRVLLRIHGPRDGEHKTKQENQVSFSLQDNLYLMIRLTLLSSFLLCLCSFPVYLNILLNRFSHPNRYNAAISSETQPNALK